MTVEAAYALWQAGRQQDALAAAWQAYDAAPEGLAEKRALSRLLYAHPGHFTADRVPSLTTLLSDRNADPSLLSGTGWRYLEHHTDLLAFDAPLEDAARAFENNALALRLLCEDCVSNLAAERALTRVRRFLLLEACWNDFPRLNQALVEQAALNGGAWPFEDDERARLGGDFTAAFLPPRPTPGDASDFCERTTRAVAEQYESWPYPSWRRIAREVPTTLRARLRKVDPDGPPVAEPAEILVAGCGSGRHAALTATRFPHDRTTAIDISNTSLDYARERLDALDCPNVELRRLDLHEAAAALGQRFDMIDCCGVLHHLPDPEAGFAALARALKPGGVMRIMVYSTLARLAVRAQRKLLGSIVDQPVNDDLLREVRRRMLPMQLEKRLKARDFFTLSGVHDLLLHRHEDAFDIPRIRRMLEAKGFAFLRFQLRQPEEVASYRAQFPDDPQFRSFENWMKIEKTTPSMRSAMYEFWCRKPAQ